VSPRAAIIWAAQAVDDLTDIHGYIARTSPHYAAVVASRIVEAIDRLTEFPESGRVVPEQNEAAVRELIEGSYRIVYELRDDRVEILTVFRTSRLFPKLSR
jgi:plasmid stabilization system protein ParE